MSQEMEFFVFPSSTKGSSKILSQDLDQNQALAKAAAAQKDGRYIDAIKIYRAILDASPRHKDALHHFGMAMYGLGRVQEAQQLLQASLVVNNDQADVHMNLARICFNEKSFDETEWYLAEVARLDPGRTELRALMGRCLAARERFAEAADQFLDVVENNPDDLDAALRLADAYEKAGNLQDAIAYYEYILQRQPTDRKARINFATLLRRSGRLNEALRQCEEGIAHAPDDVEFMHNRAALYEELGDFETAHARYLEVLEHAPDNGVVLGSLVRMRRPQPTAAVIEKAKRFVNDEKVALFERVFVLYALGSYFDNKRDYGSAFRYYAEANECQARTSTYYPASFERFVDAQIEGVAENERRVLSLADVSTERQPIFILGMPRSGTTLTEQILASHSQVLGCGEIDFFVDSFGFAASQNPSRALPDKEVLSSKAFLTSLRGRYYAHIDNLFGVAGYFTDKMPFNFLYTGLIQAAFPEAKVIHCVRHPIDVCLSCYFQNLTANHSFSMTLDSVAHYYLNYYRLMGHYRKVLGKSLITLRYDTLVDNPETVSKSLVSKCGLEWEPACLEFYNTSRAVTTPSNWQVRQPIFRSSLERRKNYEQFVRGLSEALAVPVSEYESSEGVYRS